MECLTREIRYKSRTDQFRIIPLGDIHLGNRACNEKLLRQTVKAIEDDPMAYWIGLGDYCEWINMHDKRFDLRSLPDWLLGVVDLARGQQERIIEILTPIAGKCLGLVEGNHERTMRIYSERDVYWRLAEAFGDESPDNRIPPKRCLGPAGFVQVRFKRGRCTWTLVIFATHGWWGGRLMGAGALNLERVLGWTNADVVMAGHDHKQRAFPALKLRATQGGEVEECKCWAMSTGSFLGSAEYAQAKGYRPLPVGALELLVQPDKHELRVLQ